MNSKDRQTLIGVAGIVVIQVAALSQGFNGTVTLSSLAALVAILAPEALDRLPYATDGGDE
jgi:hypothetical protein